MTDKENKIQEPIFYIEIDKTGLSPEEYKRQRIMRRKKSSISQFTKYCSIYDPTVDLKSGKIIKGYIYPDVLHDEYFSSRFDKECQITILKNLIQIPSLTKLREQYFEAKKDKSNNYSQKAGKEFSAYSCLAPYRILNPPEITGKYLNDCFDINRRIKNKLRHKKYRDKLNGSSEISDIVKDIENDLSEIRANEKQAEKMETSELLCYKQYICCEHEGEKGWMVLSRSLKFDLDEFTLKFMGIGENIIEADLDFQRKKANLFLEKMELNKEILESDAPINIQQMKTLCERFDKKIKLDSFKHKYSTEFGVRNAVSELFCQSEEYKFTVAISYSYIKWTVQTYIKAKFDIPIEANGKTLKEAFDKLREKYERLSSDSEFIQKEVEYIDRKQMQDIYRQSYQEYKDIISEFGTDTFPD